VIRQLIISSDHRCIAFKALSDSHRVLHLLEGLDTPTKARAVWIYRSMEGRVRSTMAKWADSNRTVLRNIAEDRPDGRWEGEGLSPTSLELVKSFDYDEITPASAAALLWYIRNAIYFELGLERRADVTLVSYERSLEAPEATMRALCEFLGVSFGPRMAAHISPPLPVSTARLEIDPRITSLCRKLEDRLDATTARSSSSE
jgi:hypothetical protein